MKSNKKSEEKSTIFIYEKLHSFQQNKLNREEFEAFKNQYNDLFNRLAALERSIKDLQSQGKSVRNEKIQFFNQYI